MPSRLFLPWDVTEHSSPSLLIICRFMLFGTSRYGTRSLFPSDPPAFTVPSTKTKSASAAASNSDSAPSIPPCSLRDYGLPDARWRWMSKHWMVDMRGDGEVCSEGFEYNWAFRPDGARYGWRASPGKWLGSGGWVRRRRWVRLMTRPADDRPEEAGRGKEVIREHEEPDGVEAEQVWKGDLEGDWSRCHLLMRSLNRDGRRLELWRDWLGPDGNLIQVTSDYLTAGEANQQNGTKKDGMPDVPTVTVKRDSADEAQTTSPERQDEDEQFFTPNPIPSEAPKDTRREWIVAVLRERVRTGPGYLSSVPSDDGRFLRATSSSPFSSSRTLARISSACSTKLGLTLRSSRQRPFITPSTIQIIS